MPCVPKVERPEIRCTREQRPNEMCKMMMMMSTRERKSDDELCKETVKSVMCKLQACAKCSEGAQ